MDPMPTALVILRCLMLLKRVIARMMWWKIVGEMKTIAYRRDVGMMKQIRIVG